jgi:hypothetical protein
MGILGGILVAHRITEEEKRTRPVMAKNASASKIASFLDKINHRDYAVIVFILALLDGFRVFVWLSAIGVQVFWLTELWLLTGRSSTARNSGTNPAR